RTRRRRRSGRGTRRRPRAVSSIRFVPAFSEFLLESGDALFERFDAPFHLGQTADDGLRLPPFTVGDPWIAGAERSGLDVARHAGLAARDRALADPNVTVDADLPGQRDLVFDHGAAGDSDLRREQRARPDADAVRDLHEVVDLGARLDPRLADRRTI